MTNTQWPFIALSPQQLKQLSKEDESYDPHFVERGLAKITERKKIKDKA